MTSPYEEEIARYRGRREERLRSPEGWFALVERIWLNEGENSVPFGSLSVWADRLRVTVAPGRRVTLRGESIHELDLATGDGGDVLEFEGRRYDAVRIGSRWSLRVRDPAAAKRVGFTGIPCFPADERYRVEAVLEAFDEPRLIEIPLTSEETQKMRCPGVLVMALQGHTLRLEALHEPDATRLFLLFADATNRHETYGGGRVLYAPLPDEAGRTVVDFNLALNPACVFNPLVICPLPPEGNRVSFRIEAGEQYWRPATGSS